MAWALVADSLSTHLFWRANGSSVSAIHSIRSPGNPCCTTQLVPCAMAPMRDVEPGDLVLVPDIETKCILEIGIGE